jgi:hypothetical protein
VPNPSEEKIQKNGAWLDQITNQHTSAIIAFDAKFTCTGGGGVTYISDYFFNYGWDKPIAPQSAHSFPISGNTAQCNEVSAVMYANGDTSGDSNELNTIRQRHKGVYEELQEVITKLGTSNNADYNPRNLASQLMTRASEVLGDKTIPPGERWGRHQVLYTVAHALLDQREIHVPSDDTMQRLPSMLKIAKTSNISMEQAHAIMLTRRLEEWRNELAPEEVVTTQ